jgi:type IV pilus assembly protein PilA
MNAAPRLAVRWKSNLKWAVLLLAAAGAAGFLIGLSFLTIPMFGSKKTEDERAALHSIRAIQRAELLYASTYPANGFACTLAALGGDPSTGAPSPAAAQLIPTDLAFGIKSGYYFSISCTNKVTKNGVYRYNKFAVTAFPQIVGKTGTRGFCGDQFGIIQYDPAGGTNCTQPRE